MRSAAQLTGERYLFLSDDSGVANPSATEDEKAKKHQQLHAPQWQRAACGPPSPACRARGMC